MKINLSRTGWHRRLQRRVLNIETNSNDDFPNLCPYFWLTVFCMFALPFVFLWQYPIQIVWSAALWVVVTFFGGIEKISTAIVYPFKQFICIPLDKWLVESAVRELTPEQVIKISSLKTKRDRALWDRWTQLEDNYWEKLHLFRAEAKTRREAAERAERFAKEARIEKEHWARMRRQARLMRIANSTKIIAPYVVGGIALLLVYSLLHVVFLLWGLMGTIDWTLTFWTVVRSLAWLAAGAVAVGVFVLCGLFVGMVCKKMFRGCGLIFTVPRNSKKTGPGFWFKTLTPVAEFIFAVISGVGDGFKLLGQHIKSTKDGYCPQIEWKE